MQENAAKSCQFEQTRRIQPSRFAAGLAVAPSNRPSCGYKNVDLIQNPNIFPAALRRLIELRIQPSDGLTTQPQPDGLLPMGFMHCFTNASAFVPLPWVATWVLVTAPLLGAETGPPPSTTPAKLPTMHWADTSSGRPFSKDPSVIRFGGRYLMYYSLPGNPGSGMAGWSVGIAESTDLTHWRRVGQVLPAQECDRKGLAAPCAWVRNGRVHLFYQTYGNGPKDAICHASSADGLQFERNPQNPIFAPHGDWTVGRAIDAEVFPVGNRLMLYFATRDPKMEIQMQGVAAAPLDSAYGKEDWKQLVDGPILKPELPWELKCIEAASVMQRDGKLWMFYAGGYNNDPQQIGVAWSNDGVRWTRASQQPLLANGPPGSWNSSESGHPGVFVDDDGRTYLFFQGNNDRGATWFLSKVEILWKDGQPTVAPEP